MVGRSLDNQFPKEFGEKSKEPMLEVDNVVAAGVLNDVSFQAYGGQILGFYWSGRRRSYQIMRAVFGADPIDSGKIKIKGKEAHIKSRVRLSSMALRSSPRTVRDRVWYWLRPFAPT